MALEILTNVVAESVLCFFLLIIFIFSRKLKTTKMLHHVDPNYY